MSSYSYNTIQNIIDTLVHIQYNILLKILYQNFISSYLYNTIQNIIDTYFFVYFYNILLKILLFFPYSMSHAKKYRV